MRTASYLLWIALGLSFAACAKKKDAAPPPESSGSSAAAAEPAKVDGTVATPEPPAPPPEPPTLVASNGPVSTKPAPPPATPSRAASMKPGFDKAFTSFSEYAAAELGLTVEALQAGPDGDDIKMEQTLGKAWAYSAFQKNTPDPKQIRGWATGDGTVITTKQNLGALLKEAGLWSKKPLKFDKIAKAIAWGLGPNFTWGTGLDYPPDLNPWPVLSLDKKGAGTFTFAVDSREPGPGGAGGGPGSILKVTITLAADHTATLALAKP
jgi:hypothetical protein